MVINPIQILMEGGPISITDVERELGIPHNTVLFHFKKITLSFMEGCKKRGRSKKFYYLKSYHRKLIPRFDKIIGCQIITHGIPMITSTCKFCKLSFNCFEECRFKNKTTREMEELGYNGTIYSKAKSI